MCTLMISKYRHVYKCKTYWPPTKCPIHIALLTIMPKVDYLIEKLLYQLLLSIAEQGQPTNGIRGEEKHVICI